MSEPTPHVDPTIEADSITIGLIESLISRSERILERDLSRQGVREALVRLARATAIDKLLDKATTIATVDAFDIAIRETPAEQ